jgi:hypothetical protein
MEERGKTIRSNRKLVFVMDGETSTVDLEFKVTRLRDHL